MSATLLSLLRQACRESAPEMFVALKDTAHFDLGSEDHAAALADEAVDDDGVADAAAGFFLPMPKTWVEDERSGISLSRGDKNEQGLVGSSFSMIEVFRVPVTLEDGYVTTRHSMPKRLDPAANEIFESLVASRARFPAEVMLVRAGMIVPSKVDSPWRIEAHVASLGMCAFCGRRILRRWPPPLPEEYSKDLLQDFQAACLQVLAINSPANIVVRQDSKEMVMVKDRGGRRHPEQRKRTRYLVLPRKEAYRLVTGDKSETGQQRAAHARRRHWKTLRAERYKEEKRGTRVMVRECWVGPRERVDGDTRYKVCLDLGLEKGIPSDGRNDDPSQEAAHAG